MQSSTELAKSNLNEPERENRQVQAEVETRNASSASRVTRARTLCACRACVRSQAQLAYALRADVQRMSAYMARTTRVLRDAQAFALDEDDVSPPVGTRLMPAERMIRPGVWKREVER